MADGKKPSIYQDRGTIGSAKELDEYGVWVKSEPQDLAGGDKDPGIEDFSTDELPDFSQDLEFPSEADSGPDFSIPEDDFSIADADAGETADSADSAEELPDFSLDDFSISEEENETGLTLDTGEVNAGETADSADSMEDLPDFSLDDFSISEEENGTALTLDAGEMNAGETADLPLEEDDSIPGLSLGGEDMDLSLPEESPPAEEPEESPETPEEDGGEGFDEISLEELLGEVADEIPGENPPEEAPEAGGGLSGAEDDKSTQLLMKIAGELSSIREELRALKQEFTSARGTETERAESRGFFDNTGNDDKIALTGDELNNIINTADFTEETGADAAGEELPPDLSEGDTPPAPAVSPEAESSLDELSLDDLDEVALPGETEEAAAELAEEPEESPKAEEPIEVGELSGIGELEQLDELGVEVLEDSEIPLVDFSGESITGDLSGEIEEGFPSADSEIILEEAEEPAVLEEPDISLDTSFSEEESIALENFDEDALDLTGAVIDEPDLGAEIKENPVLEPVLDDITGAEEGMEEGELLLEEETPPELDLNAAMFEEPSLPPIEEEIEDEREIARAEESAAEIPAAGGSSRGEDLDQIIPEGFVVEELDDEGEAGFGGAGLDSLEEGISLDEIPEDLPPEEEELIQESPALESPEEPEVSALPGNFKTELKQVLSYMDQLLESLPDEKIEEFAKSEYFDTYKKLFKELGLA
jgi:hypothetical protein